MDFKLQKFSTPMSVTGIANIHYFEFTNEYHSQENYHNFCELLYVDSGSILVDSENYKGELNENGLIIHLPNEKHSLKGSGSEAPNVIIIGFECESKALSCFSRIPVRLSAEHKKMLSKIMQEGMNTFEPPYDIPNTVYMKKRVDALYGSDQMLKILLECFLITLVRDFKLNEKQDVDGLSTATQLMQNVHQYLSEHYTEKIGLENLCFLFGTNKTGLCRDFKSTYGQTVLEYIHYLRIKAAKKMLREGIMTVTEISESLGFESVHYFCRLFKKHTGLSPTAYEKSVKSKLSL